MGSGADRELVIVAPTRGTRGGGPLASLAAVLLVIVSIAAGCNAPDDTSTTTTTTSAETSTTASSPPESSQTTTTPEPTSPPTSPSTTATTTTAPEPGPIAPVIEALVSRYDDAVEAILVDPSVTRDPESDNVAEYLGLFVADSPFALGAISAWQADADQGRSYRPAGEGRILESRLLELLDESAVAVTFHVCTTSNFEVTDANGAVLESQAGVSGVRGVAVLEGEEWRLRDLTQDPSLDCSEAVT